MLEKGSFWKIGAYVFEVRRCHQFFDNNGGVRWYANCRVFGTSGKRLYKEDGKPRWKAIDTEVLKAGQRVKPKKKE